MPVPAGEAAEGAAEGGEGGAAAGAGATDDVGGGGGASGAAGAGQQGEPLERDLGGDDGGWFSGFGRGDDKDQVGDGGDQVAGGGWSVPYGWKRPLCLLSAACAWLRSSV